MVLYVAVGLGVMLSADLLGVVDGLYVAVELGVIRRLIYSELWMVYTLP